MSGFEGFKPAFFKFFRELAKNNDRAWFADNKPRYEADVIAPLVSFIEAMAPRLEKISSHYVADPRPHGGSMFRIYRDIRFSKDKRPFKEHAACQFRHAAGKTAHAPGYYVHLEPAQVIFGGGVWMPAAPQLQRIREAIAKDKAGWSKVVKDKRLVAAFGGVAGDALTRPPKGFDAEHPHIEDIKRKSFFAMRHLGARKSLGPEFVDEVADAFAAATPLMRFVTKALGVPF